MSELILGKPQKLENATEKIWLTGLFHKTLQVDRGLLEPSPTAPKQHLLHILGTKYLMRRLAGTDKTELQSNQLVSHYCDTRNAFLQPTHLLLAKSLEFAYFLILRQKSDNNFPVSHFIRLEQFASIERLLGMGERIRPIVFGSLENPGGKQEFCLDTPFKKIVATNESGDITLRLARR